MEDLGAVRKRGVEGPAPAGLRDRKETTNERTA